MASRRFVIGTLAGTAAFAMLANRIAGAQQAGRGSRRRRMLVLDVIETMLDIRALAPHFIRAFGDGQVLNEWFANLLLYANVTTVAGPYADFGTLAGAVLEMTVAARGKMLASDDRNRILQGTLTLPPHPDVTEGLTRLQAAGFRMVTLTNSAPAGVAQHLRNAGLSGFFECSFSIDVVKKYKPAADTYQYVARELAVSTGDLRMIAAHAWDVHGALRAGCAAAFITRPGHALFLSARNPTSARPIYAPLRT
jgi:2-haloacid dehalogenase